MAWIYLAESEESQKPWKVTSRQSPTAKTTDMLKRCFCHEWGMDDCRKLLSGTMCKHCGEACSQTTSSKSFTVGSPAKTLAMQDAELVWKESEADYFLRSLGSQARYNRHLYSWKTSEALLLPESESWQGKWCGWGMILAGEYFPLRTWARRTDVIDGGYWPTVCKAAEAPNLGSNKRNGPRSLIQVARENWPTPRASEWKGCGPKGSKSQKYMLKKKYLCATVAEYATPQARDFRTGQHSRWENKERSRNLNDQIGGQLNPTWVEWLMGYPSEWTVLEDWAMQWFRPKREKHLKD